MTATPSALRKAAFALKEGKGTPQQDLADLLWETANIIEQQQSLSSSQDILLQRIDKLTQALTAILPLAKRYVETAELPDAIENSSGNRTTAEIILAELVLATELEATETCSTTEEPADLTNLPDEAFVDFDLDEDRQHDLNTIEGAILAAAKAIRAQNARRIAGLEPDFKYDLQKAEAISSLRRHFLRPEGDIPTGI